jgi:hypothetical protein
MKLGCIYATPTGLVNFLFLSIIPTGLILKKSLISLICLFLPGVHQQAENFEMIGLGKIVDQGQVGHLK